MSPAETLPGYLWFALAVIVTLFLGLVFLDSGRRKAARQAQRRNGTQARARETENHDLAQAAPAIAYLLRSGFRGAWVRLRPAAAGSKLAIEFDKYIRGPGDYGIQLVFPVLKWSRDFAPRIEAYCRDRGMPLRIRPKLSSHAREALFVDCGQDPELAFELGRYIWVEVFGLEASTPHRIERYGLSTDGELVDKPDQKPLSLSEA
ncbi:MAG: hypothetical protein QNJ30_17440 [Kiloniellales bacterium]|nr:hypothetical protein [Kiloniellales bacterium]